MPDLTRERFVSLAVQAGFDPADPHVGELFEPVKQMLERVATLERADVSATEPPPFDATIGWDMASVREGTP